MAFECIGGPLCGDRVKRSPEGWGAFCAAQGNDKDGIELHFYRLCVDKKRVNGQIRTARFWHYIGTNPTVNCRPTLSPPRRMYK